MQILHSPTTLFIICGSVVLTLSPLFLHWIWGISLKRRSADFPGGHIEVE